MKTGRRPKIQYLFIYGITLLVFLPVANIFISAFKTTTEIQRGTLFPSTMYFQNILNVLHKKSFYTGIMNSVVITGSALAMSTILSALASYPLSRNNGKIYTFIYIFFLSAQMIPGIANMIPVYMIFKQFHLVDTKIGMILLYGSGLTMGVLLYSSFMKNIPRELTEAAEIDGCSYVQAFRYVVFPMLKPVTITYIMVRILNIWNDFLWPQLFLPSKENQTITLLVYTFQNESKGNDWGSIFALMALSSLLPILFFVWNQKHFFSEISLGAMKG